MGAGFKSREAAKKAFKIAVKNSDGTIAKDRQGRPIYRPYTVATPLAWVLTGGNPEGKTGRVIDAIGEFQSLTMWQGHGDRLELLYGLDYHHSVGLWYSAMTQRCGLKPVEEEYILMGMAALGDPNRLTRDMLDDFIRMPIDDYNNPLQFKENLHRGCQWWRPDLTSQQDLYDIAAATQQIYEMLLERILQFALTKTSSKNLVVMGGCALNCAANHLIYKYFQNV
jgi:carbamoyltransferase